MEEDKYIWECAADKCYSNYEPGSDYGFSSWHLVEGIRNVELPNKKDHNDLSDEEMLKILGKHELRDEYIRMMDPLVLPLSIN